MIMEEERTLVEQMLELMQQKQYVALHHLLDEENPADIAEAMSEIYEDEVITENELPRLFRLLPKDAAADTFVEMDPDMQEALIRAFSDKELREIVEDMFLDDTVDVIEEMPANVVKRILRSVDAETRKSINQLLNYPEDSAGSIMTIEYVSLKKSMTVQQAFARIRQTGVDKETIYTCYVTDPGRKLLGLVSVKDLLLADYEDLIEDIMETNVIAVHTTDDKEDVAQMFSHYDFTAMPVVDKDDLLVGIVTVDDAIDVIQEEATEDFEKMAAILPSDKPYLKTGVLEIWRNRIPWLLMMMLSATFTGIIINSFESALAKTVALTAFIPMLMGTGGNSGSQASVTITRSMSLGDVEFSDLLRVMWTELRVSVLCGVTLAVCNFAKLMLFDRVGFAISMVVSLTLVATVVVAKLVGCSLPMLAEKVGLDPAVMASPLITTIVDAISLLLYFSIASAMLGL